MEAVLLSHRMMSPDEIYAEFSEMRIKHPQQEAAVAVFKKLRQRMITAPYAGQTAVKMFAGSQSGKTTTVEWYIEKFLVDEWLAAKALTAKTADEKAWLAKTAKLPRRELAKLQTIALHVELTGGTTMSSLMSDFLVALGDPEPYSGTYRQRRYRVEKALSERGYQIIFIDEIQHLKTPANTGPVSRTDDATEVQNTFKGWVKRWPIVFVGTQHAEKVVFEHQIATRSHKPIDFRPLHYGDAKGRKDFDDFCGRLSLKIVEHRILPERPRILVEGDVPLCLNIASKGRLGVVAIIVRNALENMVEGGHSQLTREHLATAVEDYSQEIKLCSYNPFRTGPIFIPSPEEYAKDVANDN
ncbi:ATP-binding protein [Rhizobium leguminosarum]|uniref:ATP-binding protein n=1 Tax=Rhizobium leguminosarum TaxID=384 RepID=UPI001C97414C|nr:ATP-binding protein [Rhizobium leguminosarum]MBY5422291.1 AAA family ATPase [Rhizobium leguminosarum]